MRYAEADGGRLAAAVTYYAFFATFALALLGFALFGFVLDHPAVQRSVQRYLDQNLPNLDVQALRTARGAAGVIAFLGLPVTGWFWVNALRSSIRKVWRLPEYPGTFIVRLLIDLLVLTGLGLLLVVSLATAFTTTALASRLIDTTGADAALTRGLLAVVGLVVGVAVNTLLSIAVLTGLPRLRMPPRRVALPALLVAIGLELLKTVGGFFVQRIEANPTYHVVAGTVGLLVSLSVVNQLVLFAAALTATATIGDVTDLALGGKLPRTPSDQDIATAEPTTVPDTGSAREQTVDHRSPG
ncbi:YihY/virulence factor BrkB family protein [Micromonospora sp. KC721]|uniref:YihY/virulence factor BrkB family protein n=1 Tax=Micromonospora sp. KC721 TaxID=2530380 RepID=UPI001FB5DD5B|nr:YihY/virulence factor BrkB family protein [Micromonospora sp. KC721]